MKKYESVKQIDLTKQSRSSHHNHERKKSLNSNSCKRSVPRSLSK